MLPLCYQSIYPSLLSSCCRRIVAAVTSWCHLHCHVVVVSSLPLRCRLHHRIVAVTLLRFCRCHHGVTFTSVMVSSSLLWCRLRVGRGFIVAIVVLPLSSHCHGFVIV